jgi:hypothetical protein
MLTYADSLLPTEVQKEAKLPYNIQGKLDSIHVELRDHGVSPKVELKFKGLTLTEIESQYFSNKLLYRVYLGWYDFLGVSGSAYAVAQGIAQKAVVNYARSGYELTLELSSVGTNFLDQQFPSNFDTASFRELGLEGVLKLISHLAGLDAVFIGESLVQLLEQDKTLMEEAKKKLSTEIDLAKAIAEACPDTSTQIEDREYYFAPWCTFFTFPLVAQGTKRNVAGTIIPNTPSGLLLYLRSIYRFNVLLSGSYLMFSAVLHHSEVKKQTVAPQRYFKYRGGMAGEGASSAQSAALSSAASSGPMGIVGGAFGINDILHDDPFEDFVVVESPQLASGNVVAPSGKKVDKKQAVVKDVEYDLSSVRPDWGASIGKTADKGAAMARARAYKDKSAAQRRADSLEKDVETVLHIPGVQKSIKPFILTALATARTLGQVAKVTGVVGAPDLSLGMYFYFEGRVKDTGYYLITGIDHTYSVSQGFKSTLYGKLVEDPFMDKAKPPVVNKTVEKKREAKVAQEKYRIRILNQSGYGKVNRVKMKSGRGVASFLDSGSRDDRLDRAGMWGWEWLIEERGLVAGVDYSVVEVSKASYLKAIEIRKKMDKTKVTMPYIAYQRELESDKAVVIKGKDVDAWLNMIQDPDMRAVLLKVVHP